MYKIKVERNKKLVFNQTFEDLDAFIMSYRKQINDFSLAMLFEISDVTIETTMPNEKKEGETVVRVFSMYLREF